MDKDEILSELKLILEGLDKSEFNYNKASLFQGVIMETISTEYAEKMHIQGLKPYSQCVRLENDKIVWHIYTMSAEAYSNIIEPMLSDEFNTFKLRHDEIDIKITGKEVNKIRTDELFENFYSKSSGNCFVIYFKTPTSFKKNKKYCFYPDMFNIYQSLMMKFDSVSANEGMFNENTLEQLTENTEIIGYNLKSVNYSVESVRIPAFTGNIRIKIHGPQTMVNFANLLFQFGNYSGVGIKTAMGMGNIYINEKERRVNR